MLNKSLYSRHDNKKNFDITKTIIFACKLNSIFLKLTEKQSSKSKEALRKKFFRTFDQFTLSVLVE